MVALEARYRLLADNTSDVVLEIDEDGLIRWASPSVRRVLGWSPEELIATRAADLLAPGEESKTGDVRSRVFGGEIIQAIQLRVRTADGNILWMSTHAQPVRDESGAIVAQAVGARDCHAEVTAERALRALSAGGAVLVRAETEHDLLAEMCQNAVDHAGYVFSWYGRPVPDTARAVEAIASSREHRDYLDENQISWGDGPLGQGPTGVALRTGVTAIVADIRAEATYAPWRAAAAARGFRSSIHLPIVVEGSIDGAFMVYAAEADAFTARSQSVLEDLAAQIGYGLARLRDTQRLARSMADQALLNTAIDQAAEAIVVTDADASILYANPAAARSSGYPLEEMLGQNPRLFGSGLYDRTFFEAMWGRLLGGDTWSGVLVNRRKTGEIYEEETTIAPVHDASGARIAYVAMKRDLTVERRLEAHLGREQNDRLALVELMEKVRPAATMEATAAAFSQAVTALDDIDAARVFLIEPNGAIIPIGIVGPTILGWQAGEPLNLAQLDRIIEVTTAGPWWIDLLEGSALPNQPEADAMITAGFSAAGFAPIRWEGELVGALAIATQAQDGPQWMKSRLAVLEELASFAGILLGSQAQRHGQQEALRAKVRYILDHHRYHSVFQPVVEMATGSLRGYEALTRFDDHVGPDLHFAEAHAIGLGPELEAACVKVALSEARRLPPDVWISVNFSPTTVISGHAASVVGATDRPVVIEITEHAAIESYPAVRHAIQECGPVQVSVDDAGAGFASLRHILELQPDMVKLDIGLVRNIDTDPARQALAAGLRHFAALTDTVLVAEGVETPNEANTLRRLGVELAQGYLFGRPLPPTGAEPRR